MRSHQFNRRTPHNVVGADVRQNGDEFNRARKVERFLGAKQFSSSNAKELLRFSAVLGARSMRLGSTGNAGAAGTRGTRGSSGTGGRGGRSATGSIRATSLVGTKKRNNAWFPSKRFLRSAIVMIVGGLSVMNTYTSAVEKRETRQVSDEPQSAIAEEEGVWNWSGDFTAATFYLPGRGELPVVITISEEIPPTCTEEGSRTYLATVETDGTTYTDTMTEALLPTGHSFGEGSRTGDEIVFSCSRCGEKITIGLTIDEEE